VCVFLCVCGFFGGGGGGGGEKGRGGGAQAFSAFCLADVMGDSVLVQGR